MPGASCGFGKDDTAIVGDTDLAEESFEDFVCLFSCENVIVRRRKPPLSLRVAHS